MTKQYAERDAMALDEAGGHYMRHVMAMTGEKLHGKGDIAAELGWRDMQISDLQQKLDAVLAENVALKQAIDTHKHGFVRCECCGEENMCHSDDVCRVLDETPATDAILNEVRAEGVDLFISELSELFKTLKTGGKPWQAIKGVAMRGAAFADQLRAGSKEGGV